MPWHKRCNGGKVAALPLVASGLPEVQPHKHYGASSRRMRGTLASCAPAGPGQVMVPRITHSAGC